MEKKNKKCDIYVAGAKQNHKQGPQEGPLIGGPGRHGFFLPDADRHCGRIVGARTGPVSAEKKRRRAQNARRTMVAVESNAPTPG